jgi:hypothetical protein
MIALKRLSPRKLWSRNATLVTVVLVVFFGGLSLTTDNPEPQIIITQCDPDKSACDKHMQVRAYEVDQLPNAIELQNPMEGNEQ